MSRIRLAVGSVVVWCISASAGAQAARDERGPLARHNVVQAQLGGSAALALSYERLLSRTAGLRLTCGAIPMIGLGVVAMPQVMLGQGRHRGDLAAGVQVVWHADGTRTSDPEVRATAELAYRYQTDGGFVFRAGVGLLGGAPVPALSAGWSF